MDPVSIAMAAAMVFGLLSADAVVSANTVTVNVSVPPAVASTGLSQDVAERVFTSEIWRMSQARSLLSPASVRSSRDPTIVGVVANALKLDGFTAALQDLFGLERPRVNASIIYQDANRSRLLISGITGQTTNFSLQLDGEAGAEALLRRGATETMEQFEPYRSALYYFEQSLNARSNDFSRTKAVAERELARVPSAETIVRRAFLENLLGVVALMENDKAGAARRFRNSFTTHPIFHVGRLNLGFVLIELDRYQEAIDLLTPLTRVTLSPSAAMSGAFAPLFEALHSTIGVARWGLGDLDGAELSFRDAVRAFPETEAAYTYWARLLRDRGRTAEAEEKEAIARVNALTFDNYPEVANLFFWMNHKDNQPLVRRASRVARLN